MKRDVPLLLKAHNPKLYLFLIVLLSLAFCETKAAEPLRWAADAESNAPFIFQDPKQPTNLIGFEIEIMQLISKELGRRSQFVQNQWDGLIPGLARKNYDIAINGLEITDDRRNEVFFSKPYYITSEQIIVRMDNSNIASMKDLKGKQVGVLKYSLAERILNAEGGINILSYEGETNAFEDLKNGRTEAVLVDSPIALYYVGWNKELKSVGDPVGEIYYGIAISKDNPELLAQINSALDVISKNGSLRKVLDRWKLWNAMMAIYLEDRTPSTAEPVMYNQYVESQSTNLSLGGKIMRYVNFLPLLGKGALMTLEITILSMLLAIVVGLMLAIVRVYFPKPFCTLATIYIEAIRGTPLLIQLFFIFYALPTIGIKLSPFLAAILGLGLNYAAYEAENYRAGLSGVHSGQMEAALSLGMRRRHALKLVILPQAFRIVIPPVTNDFISLLKDSSLVSVITMVELTKVYGQLASTYYDYIGTGIIVAAIYLLLGLPFVKLSKMAEKRLAIEKIKTD